MRLFLLYLVLDGLLASLVSSNTAEFAANNHTIIRFDDIKTESGLANVPFPYNHLSFASYSVFKPQDPALENLISEHDLNCAISSPNALLGSRTTEHGKGACFQVANASAMKEQGLSPYFTLSSFYIKPMDAPAPGTTIYVKGYRLGRKEPLTWHVDFPSGYHLPFKVKMQDYSVEEWNEMYKIEITADFGYDSLDWEFCMDDLEIQFFALTDQEDKSNDKMVVGQSEEL